MRRRPRRPPPRRWFAVRDGAGTWVIVDTSGNQPLRDADPFQRLHNLHLAAAAPALRDALVQLVHRLEYLLPTITSSPPHDRGLYQEAQAALADTHPRTDDILRIAGLRGQREIDFDVGQDEPGGASAGG